MSKLIDRLSRLAFLVLFVGIVAAGAVASYPRYRRMKGLAEEKARVLKLIEEKKAEIAELKERRRKERDRKRRSRAVGKVKKALGDDYADVVKAWLGGQTWSDIGVPRQTFWDRLKKVKDFFGLENIG